MTIWRTISLHLVFLFYSAQGTLYRTRKVYMASVWFILLAFLFGWCSVRFRRGASYSLRIFIIVIRSEPKNVFFFSGLVTNIPANMVVDQFGMIGLLTFIRAGNLSTLFPWPTLLALTQHLKTAQISLSHSTLHSGGRPQPGLTSPWGIIIIDL